MPLSLVPRERRFFVLFREEAANLSESVKTLNEMFAGETEAFASHAKRLRDLEHQGDEITHRIIRELDVTFITPFDREDIYALATTLDDIVDLVEETADTVMIDRIDRITPEARQMADILLKMSQELVDAIDHLDAMKNMKEHWVAMNDLENQGDRVTRAAIGALFENNSQDPVTIIKWKDVYALLEKTIDRTEDIANILESVTIRNA